MARKPRFAPPDYWLHITLRGNYRQDIFRHDGDRTKYLELLARYAEERQIQVMGYDLMSNHVHLIAMGKYPHAISDWMRCLNGHFAQRMHFLKDLRGQFWQDRYYSCVLDERHLRNALRYVELNPVRAGLVQDATQYPWSSAAAHAGHQRSAPFLNQDEFCRRYSADEWRLGLTSIQPENEVAAIRAATRLGYPLGSPEFIARLELELNVKLPRFMEQARARSAGSGSE